jgi:hypothetical protein
VAEAFFRMYQASLTGQTTNYFTLHGTNGRVTSADLWMPNNVDPSLQKYNNSVQYTMKFGSMSLDYTGSIAVSATIP